MTKGGLEVMKIVLLFFCIIVILFVMILFSKIKLDIKKCKITNIVKGIKQKTVEKEFEIYLGFYLLGVIRIFRIKINKKLFEKLKIKEELKSVKKDVKIVQKVHLIEIIKSLKIELEKLKMYLALGTEDVMLTVSLITTISSLIRNSIQKC